jgi:hypothetical protein
VDVASGSINVPFLRYLRTSNLKGGRAEAQSSVPTIEVDAATIKAGQTKVKFPPRMKRR